MAKRILVLCVFIGLLFGSTFAFAQKEDSSLLDFKASYSDLLVKYTNNRQEYLKAVNKYKSACTDEAGECDSLKAEAILKAKSYLLSVYDLAISYSELSGERIKEYAQNESENNSFQMKLEGYKKWFAEKKDLSSSKSSKEEVEAAFTDLKSRWEESEAFFTSCRGYIYAWKMEKASSDIEEFLNKVEDKTKAIGNGKIYPNLEGKIKQSRANLDNIKILTTEIRDLSSKITADSVSQFSSIEKKVDEAVNLYKDSMNINKSLIDDLKNKNYGDMDEKKEDTLYVKGGGKIILEGSFKFTGTLGDQSYKGTIILSSSDSISGIQSQGEKIGSDKIKYSNLSYLSAQISKEAQTESGFIDVTIEGKGTAKISGDGLYKHGEDGDWTDISKQEITINLE